MVNLTKREAENDEIIQDIKIFSNSILSHVSRMKKLQNSSQKRIPFNVDSDDS